MKKYLLSAVLLLVLSISAKAQFSLGIKGGVNYSNINANNFSNSSVAGYQVGAFARFGGNFYLQPEVYVSSTGGKFQSEDNSYTGNVRFTNLNVPLLLGARFGPQNLNFRIMAGPEYISNLSTSENFSQNFNSAYNDFGHYKNSTLGYQAGFGLDLGAITADLRYQGNFNDIDSNYGQRPNIWALSVGFKIL
jgi:hypothetical protein